MKPIRNNRELTGLAALDGRQAPWRARGKTPLAKLLAGGASPRGALLAGMIGSGLLASTQAFAQGCAMCGTAVTSPSDPLARGLLISILLMLSVPYLLVLSVGLWLYLRYRRARAGDGFGSGSLAAGCVSGSGAGLPAAAGGAGAAAREERAGSGGAGQPAADLSRGPIEGRP